jgi:arylsulfatase/arylsulfatase A
MITNVDRNVGRLQEKLKALNIVENTIVIFMVDNGPNGRRYVAGFNGNKTTVWEGGIRSPFFVQWPARLKPGTSSDIPSAHIDVLPTLLDAAGVEKPKGLKIDGNSMLPMLEGKRVTRRHRHLVIQSHRGDQPVAYHNFMIRNGRWKLLHASGFGRESFKGEPNFQLFDLANDPFELSNLAGAKPNVVKQLRTAYDKWFADVGSTRQDNYAPPRILVGTKFENPVVLSRQDWRHVRGRPWAVDSMGYWLLTATQGKYDVNCRFSPSAGAGTATLSVNGKPHTINLPPNAKTCQFKVVEIAAGNVKLDVELTHGKKQRGVHQTDIEKLN